MRHGLTRKNAGLAVFRDLESDTWLAFQVGNLLLLSANDDWLNSNISASVFQPARSSYR